jgi:protein-disulfide isomerase
MSKELANRLVFVLACAGAFVALVIGVAHAGGVELPCGGVQSGCDVIGRPENSRWFNIPIAFFGAAAYCFLALCALARAAVGPAATPKLGTAMWMVLGLGTIISLGLIGYAFNSLHATCLWCLSSAVIMTIAFVIHTIALLNPSDRIVKPMSFGSHAAILSLALVGGAGYGFYLLNYAKSLTQPHAAASGLEYYLPTSHTYGDRKAPITIVEFSDLYCPTCRKWHGFVANLVDRELKGKVKLVIRQWPVVDQHPLAVTAAMLSEWAAEKGRFWEFVHQAHQIEDKNDLQQLLAAVKNAGLEPQEAAAILKDKELQLKYLETIQTDIGDGNKLGVASTPTWFAVYPNGEVETAVANGIEQLIRGKRFQAELASAR